MELTWLYVIPLAVALACVYVLVTGSKRDKRFIGIVLAILAVLPLWDGVATLAREHGRWQDGRVASAVLIGRVAADADETPQKTGHRTRYERRRLLVDFLLTSDGYRFDDYMARLLLTGSLNGWRLHYRYACGAGWCEQTDFVTREVWTGVRVGEQVNMRFAAALPDRGRLDSHRQWPTGVVKVGIACVLGLFAGYLTGRLKLRRKFVTVPAIVTTVDPVTSGGGWRIGFAYLSTSGVAYESSDVVYVQGITPGDDCQATYPDGQPPLASLRLS